MIKSSDSTQLLSVQSVAIVLKQITLFSAHRGIIFIHQTLLSIDSYLPYLDQQMYDQLFCS